MPNGSSEEKQSCCLGRKWQVGCHWFRGLVRIEGATGGSTGWDLFSHPQSSPTSQTRGCEATGLFDWSLDYTNLYPIAEFRRSSWTLLEGNIVNYVPVLDISIRTCQNKIWKQKSRERERIITRPGGGCGVPL